MTPVFGELRQRAWYFALLGLSYAVLQYPRILEAQVRKSGPEFQVNTFTEFLQLQPRVETLGANQFIVVWVGSNPIPAHLYGVRAQVFDRSGAREGTEFLVSSHATADLSAEQYPVVASSGNGQFVVAWESYYSSEESRIAGQRYDADHMQVGGEVSISTSIGVDSHEDSPLVSHEHSPVPA